MRALTNIMVFLVAVLAVIGLYVFRQQSFANLQQKFGVGRERARAVPRNPVVPAAAPKAVPVKTASISKAPAVRVTMTVLPVEPKPLSDSIQIGMQKKKLWRTFGEPDVMTSSREGERFLETFIYLPDASRATVVRLVNGTVVSVSATKTVNPPLVVPRADRATSVFLTSDSM